MILHDDPLCTLYLGDCVEVMRELPAESVDAVVTDPPYWLSFMGKAWDGSQREDEDAGFGYYLSGLVDGEGHFRVQAQARGTYSCAFSIHMRLDDRAILVRAQRFLGVGSVTEEHGEGHSPMARLNVQAKADCLRVVEVLTRYPLRAKKLRDFLPWAESVLEWNGMKRGHRWSGKGDWSRLAALKTRIESAREYRDPPWSGNSYQDWTREWAEEALRVLKPGGHLLSFSGTRTYHRMTSGLEDAGWEIRDCLVWAYASGFPKSLDVSKAIDRAAGAEREVVGVKHGDKYPNGPGGNTFTVGEGPDGSRIGPQPETAPATPDAAKWNGWGTALKPAWEPIVMARKPLRGTVAANVLAHGTGALNIDATRIGFASVADHAAAAALQELRTKHPGGAPTYGGGKGMPAPTEVGVNAAGRWPANLILTDPIFDGDTPGVVGGGSAEGAVSNGRRGQNGYGGAWGAAEQLAGYGDSGTYSRFFIVPKSSRSDREPLVRGVLEEREVLIGAEGHKINPMTGKPVVDIPRQNAHPTVKPVDLMRHLVRLVTPPGGTVLDPFLGSGTTAIAANAEGFRCIGIEKEREYLEITLARMTHQPLGMQL